ncbi:MAG: hypothetical protein ACK6CU_12090 [Deltaproteobacteria bacterium]
MLLLATGCAGPLSNIPAESRARFDRCYPHILPVSCATSIVELCGAEQGQQQAEYAELEEAQQTTWLIERGCPADVVSGNR